MTDTARRPARATDERLPAELVLHVGTAAVPVAACARSAPPADGARRPADPGPRRCRCAPATGRCCAIPAGRPSPPGCSCWTPTRPPLRRRGAAAARARELAGATGRPDAVGRGRPARRRARARTSPASACDTAPLPDVGGWLVDPDAPRVGWVAAAGDAVDAWAAAHPLDPAMPAAALRHELGLPAAAARPRRLVAAAGLQAADGRVQPARPRPPRSAVPRTPCAPSSSGCASSPFAAPERDELAALRLGHARARRGGRRPGGCCARRADIVLLPGAVDEAVRLLAALPQPFTASAARQALGTTRRVVIPLLEHLDELGRTERVDGTTRRVR